MERSAIEYIRGRLGADPADREEITRVLLSWAREHGAILPEGWNRGYVHVTQRNEHEVWFDQRNDLAFKATHGRRFGLGFNEDGYPSALNYLDRIVFAQKLFNTEWHLIGVWLHINDVRIVTRQRWIRGRRCSQTEILELLEARRFRAVEVAGKRVFYRPDDGLCIADLHEGNVIATNKGLVPIDVIIGRPGTELANLLISQISTH